MVEETGIKIILSNVSNIQLLNFETACHTCHLSTCILPCPPGLSIDPHL